MNKRRTSILFVVTKVFTAIKSYSKVCENRMFCNNTLVQCARAHMHVRACPLTQFKQKQFLMALLLSLSFRLAVLNCSDSAETKSCSLARGEYHLEVWQWRRWPRARARSLSSPTACPSCSRGMRRENSAEKPGNGLKKKWLFYRFAEPELFDDKNALGLERSKRPRYQLILTWHKQNAANWHHGNVTQQQIHHCWPKCSVLWMKSHVTVTGRCVKTILMCAHIQRWANIGSARPLCDCN